MNKVVLGAFVVLGTAGLAGFWSGTMFNSPPPDQPHGGVFAVERGDSLSRVANRLEAQGMIRSALFFNATGRVTGTQARIKAGYYAIPGGASALEIHALLVQGHQEPVKVTIPEGWTVSKVAAQLEAAGVTTAADFREVAYSRPLLAEYDIRGDSVEGYLYPDTYFLPRGYPAEAVVRTMLDTFMDRIDAIVPGFLEMDPRERHQVMILASIVEREYQRPEEAPLIASVFYNRLAHSVGLESCATVAYIITEVQGKPHPEVITLQDLRIDSAFNTYKWHGLPPGPISSPGRVAIAATFDPPETDYWYFVLQDPATGRHYFSRDLQEHNQAKFYYLKSETTAS